MNVGYARVSTSSQNLENQINHSTVTTSMILHSNPYNG